MKKLKVLLAFFVLAICVNNFANTPDSFTLGDKTFLLNGKPFVIRAGEIHFPRIPREYWEQRIQMCKAMGMNTICIYMFWNYHEQQPGVFDFNGQKDVAEFVSLVQKNGMYCIVRPGPYACAEWDMGGLPWWLLKKTDIQVRTKDDAYFMERAEKYLKEVGKQLSKFQIQKGGNIIMVQVENEYGVWGKDAEYMTRIRNILRDAGFDKVQYFRCDWSSNFNNYKVDSVAICLNFGAGSNINDQFKKFKEIYPTQPLMCSEYWSGWFDHWGKRHETRSINSFIGSMKDMMDQKISFSLYMAHGGTTFGQWGGANSPPYSCMATSYDYNAPIDEAGNPTDKFYAVRDLLKNYLNEGETLADIPKSYPIIEIPSFKLSETANLFDNLPEANKSADIQSMEMFDQGWGRILYRTTLPVAASKSKLFITSVRDWALVFVDGKQIGVLDRRRNDKYIDLPEIKKEAQLDILVEAMGRVNYDRAIIDRKGITQKVEFQNGNQIKELKNWLIYNFPVDYDFQKKAKFTNSQANGPAWYKASFDLENTGDAFLDLSTWKKGMVWVNGYNIGRYWYIGPQQTLYMPGCWLKKGKNEIIVLELLTPKENAISGKAQPILDKNNDDEEILHKKIVKTLNLTAETPVIKGVFPDSTGWRIVNFGKIVEARYFCLEALSSQNPQDRYTSVAELEIIGSNGKSVSRQNWNAVFADSEEEGEANCEANKVYDQQESTLWHTNWDRNKNKFPHQIVIDMGEVVKISGFRYLPRSDNNKNGMIKEFNFYTKTQAFDIK